MDAPGEIRDVSIYLDPMPDRPELEGFAHVCYAGLCIRGIELVRTPHGDLMLNFPQKPAMRRCPACNRRVGIQHPFCCACGLELPPAVPKSKPNGRPRLYHDVCFPANAEVRAAIEQAVFTAYHKARADALAIHAKAG